MKVCLIAEGSYPYVLGGVSSWINKLILKCPEHEFVIIAITPKKEEKGNYRYSIPNNVVEIKDIFLDEIDLHKGRKGKKLPLSDNEQNQIYELLSGNDVDWKTIFGLFNSRRLNNINEFFMSKTFFELVKKLYIEKYPFTPFSDFLWTMRTMYLSFFYTLLSDIPKADIYHSVSTGYSGIVGSYAKEIYNKPFILSEHGIYTREREEEIIKADWVKGYYKNLWIEYFYNFSNCAYDYADIVTTLFENNKNLQIDVGCSEEKLEIIPNGVDIEAFSRLKSEKKEDVINIGAIVRIVPIKDIKTMLSAFKIVKERVKNAHFYIMGPSEEDKDYYNECKDLLEFLAIEDVTFTGVVDVKKYVGNMDIMVLTSISEGQPLSVIEGMAARKPHVTTNVGDCKGLLYGESDDDLGHAGYVEGIMDSRGIANSIIRLSKNPDIREKFGEIAYKRVSEKYKEKTFIEKFKNIYLRFGSG